LGGDVNLMRIIIADITYTLGDRKTYVKLRCQTSKNVGKIRV